MSSQRCAVCGFQNPAGSAFCENCGRQLPDPGATVPADGLPPTVPVPDRSAPQPAPWGPGAQPPYPVGGSPPRFPTPPTGVAPQQGPTPPPAAPWAGRPSPPPPAFSPYYHPGGMPPPVSRTSPGLIVGIAALALVALVVLSLAGFLVVRRLASIPQTANPGPVPVATPRSGPTSSPTSPPQGGGGGAVTNKSLSLDPGSFHVTKRTDAEVDLQGSAGGVAVAAGQPDSPTTTPQELSHIQQQLESQYGSVQTCVDPQTFTIGGKSGTLQGWLYTDTDSSGNQVQVCDAYWVDASRNGNLYEYEQLGDNSTWNSQLEPAAQPVRDSIQWLV